MTRLTWENVANPNFSGVADSYRVMSELLGKAAASGKNALDIFGDAKTSAADKAILQRQLAARTAGEFDPTAVIGNDAANASIDALKGVGEWGGTLLARDGIRQTQEQTGKNNAYLNEGRDQAAGNAGAINAAIAAAAGNPAALANLPTNLRPDLYGAVAGDVSSLMTSDLNRDSTSQRMKITDWNQSRDERSAGISDAVVVALDDVQKNTFDAASAQEYVQSRTDWSPEVRTQVLNRLGGGQPTGAPNVGGAAGAIAAAIGGPVSGTSGSPISATGNPYDTLFGDTSQGNSYGFKPSKPVSQMSIQEAVDFGKGTMIPATKGKIGKGEKGTSAVGAYQFISSTLPGLAEQTFGKDWKSVPMTPENQDLMAQKLFEQNKNGNLQDTWEGLPDTRRGAYANKTWPEMKAEIFRHEVGTTLTPEETRLGAPNPGRALTENLSTANSASDRAIGNLTSVYTETLGNNNFPNEAAKALAQRIGEGADEPALLRQVNDLINESKGADGKSKINAAQAAAIIELSLDDSTRGADWWGARDAIAGLWGGGNLPVGNGKSVDRAFAKALVADTGSGAVESRLRTAADQQQIQSALNGLDQQVLARQARYAQAVEAAKIRPGIANQLPRLKAEMEQAIRDAALARKTVMESNMPVTPQAPAPAVSMSGRITGR